MKLGERIVILTVVLIMMVLLGNVIYEKQSQLEEVVFFKHYIDMDQSSQGYQIQVYYITNKHDDRVLNYVRFGDDFLQRMHSTSYDIGPYKIVEQWMIIASDSLEARILKGGTAEFNNMDNQSADLGEISLLYPIGRMGSMKMTSSSNSGENHSVYYYEEPVKLIKIKSQMLPRVIEDLKVQVIPEHYTFNDVVNYSTVDQVRLPMDIEKMINVFSYIDTTSVNIYDIILELEFESTDETTQIHNINSRPEMNMKTIKRVLESRGL
jgi:hypothetical protein